MEHLSEKILVTRSSMPTLDEYVEEIKDMWDTHILTNMGAKHQKLQEELKQYLGVEKIELLVNGHMALELSLQALLVNNARLLSGGTTKQRKMEIITTPFTFASTTHAIVRNGFEPVFCDINPDDYTIDTSKIENLITDYTVAIMPVHVYGNVCNVEEIDRIAKKYGLKVIYDAAHAFGETYKGRGVGGYGDVSCFSFHATKVFNTIEGGAACYADDDFGKQLYKLKNFGIKDMETVDGIGANAKMNEFCAAMGICNLRHVDEDIEMRKIVSDRYTEHFDGIKGIKVRQVQKDVECNYSYYPVYFDERVFGKSRNEIYEILQDNGIIARKYFYPLSNQFDCFKGTYDVSMTPTALDVSHRILTLPIYPELSEEQVDRICDLIVHD